MTEWAQEAVDFGRAARDYGRHRQGFPDSFFERLHALGVGLPGQRLLDVGTGTGSTARALARRGAEVTGLDRSPELLAQARALDEEAGVSIEYVNAPVEETGLDDDSYDVVTAARCWRWFDEERACAELRRVLRHGGRLVVAQLDWLPREGSVAAATEALILRHNPGWPLGGLDGLPTQFVRDLERGGFVDLETFSYDVDLTYTHADWRGRIRASAGVAATLAPAEVERFDAEHAAVLAEHFPGGSLGVPHRVFAVACRTA